MRKIIIAGGAGDLAHIAAQRLLELDGNLQLILGDRDAEKAERRAATLGDRVSSRGLDIFQPGDLRQAIRGCDLLVNATGPYYLTGRPVLEAAIDEQLDYIDFSDDVESAEVMLALDRSARQAGITALIGAGIAPGIANVAVRELAARLDRADAVRIAWLTGGTPRRPGQEGGGRAVIEHMLHSCIGLTYQVRDGRRHRIPAFRRGEVLPFAEPLGRRRVYDIGHAELATVPTFLRSIRNVRTLGAVYPAAANGVFQGLAMAVTRDRLSWDAAVDFLMALERGETLPPAALPAAIKGILQQLFRRELGPNDLRELIGAVFSGPPEETAGGLYIHVEGEKSGRPAGWIARTSLKQTADRGGMDDVTATPLAVFADMMLRGEIRQPGVVAPEAVCDPGTTRRRLAELGYDGIDALFTPQPSVTMPL